MPAEPNRIGATLPHPKGKGEWYFVAVHECPICGKTEVFRERRHDTRPERYEDRHEYFQTMGCGSHFL